MHQYTKPRLRTKTGCLTCRLRRKKCDEKVPTCGNCISGSRDCHWPSTADSIDRRFASHAEHRHRQTITTTPGQIPPKVNPEACSFDHDFNSTPSHPGLISSDSTRYSLRPLAEATVAQKVILPEIELKLSQHFVQRYFTFLLLPYCHSGFLHGWLADIQHLMITHKSLYYSVLACSASHLSFIETSNYRMKDLSLTYYGTAITELLRPSIRVSESENYDALLMSAMMLYIIALTSWDVDHGVPCHLTAATRLLNVRFLNQPAGLNRLFDRLAVESVMYRIFLLMTGLWSDSARPEYQYDHIFWKHAEELLDRNTFFPGTSRTFNSPVLGVPANLFRITFSLRQFFYSVPLLDYAEFNNLRTEVTACEAALLHEISHGNGMMGECETLNAQERYAKDMNHLFTLLASLMLQQISQHDTTIGVPRPVPRDSWQTKLGIQILKRNASDDGWAKCFVSNWLIYTLGLFTESLEDRQVIRRHFQRIWNISKFAQVARYKIDLERLWASSTSVSNKIG